MGSHVLIDLTDKNFGRLHVISKAGKQGCETTWLCKCECGNYTTVAGGNLRAGRTKSCGCLHDEVAGQWNKSHGQTGTRLYRIWKNMKTRCYNPNFPNFKYWGGKGITICDEWKNSFLSFATWAKSNGYADALTIDRIDSSLGYFPENCRWVSACLQNRNRDFSNFKNRRKKDD